MKWWCGSEATPLVTPLSLCFCDSACVRGYQLKVKSSENRCTHYSIYWKSVMLPYIETLLFAFWNHLILKVPKENWVEKKNRRQVKNLQIYVPPKHWLRKWISHEPIYYIQSYITYQCGYVWRNASLGDFVIVWTSQSALMQTSMVQPTTHLGSVAWPSAPGLPTCMACYFTDCCRKFVSPQTIFVYLNIEKAQ